MKPAIVNSIEKISALNISLQRKLELQPLINYIKAKTKANELINLNFICTHNSRRSHLGQIWAQTMASFFNIANVQCYSGGTEATAMFYKVAETITLQGFETIKLSDNTNPVYAVKFADDKPPIICFSKKYNDSYNPKNNYAAVVTCNDADENCPIVFGAEARIPIKYNDPKAYDNTPQMDEKYMERSLEIAGEMAYVFEQVSM